MKTAVSFPTAFLLLLCLTAPALAEGPTVTTSDVWIRSAPVGVMALSGYMTLENLTDQPLQITAMSSPDFESVTISPAESPDQPHSTLLMTSFTLPAHKPVVFSQDSYHLHLLKPHKHLYEGDMVTLMFKFSDGASLTLLAPVRHDAPGQ